MMNDHSENQTLNRSDKFSLSVRRQLADQVGGRCSNPECGACLVGPKWDGISYTIGESAHITADAPTGPRYDPSLTSQQRRSTSNGIWLCGTCHIRIDKDEKRFPVSLLLEWKAKAVDQAAMYMGKPLPFLRPSEGKVAAALFLFAGCVIGVFIMCEHRTDVDLWWCGWALALLSLLALIPILLHQDTPIQSMGI